MASNSTSDDEQLKNDTKKNAKTSSSLQTRSKTQADKLKEVQKSEDTNVPKRKRKLNRVSGTGFTPPNKKTDRNNTPPANIKPKKELGEDRKKKGGTSKKFSFSDKKLSPKTFPVFEGTKGLFFQDGFESPQKKKVVRVPTQTISKARPRKYLRVEGSPDKQVSKKSGKSPTVIRLEKNEKTSPVKLTTTKVKKSPGKSPNEPYPLIRLKDTPPEITSNEQKNKWVGINKTGKLTTKQPVSTGVVFCKYNKRMIQEDQAKQYWMEEFHTRYFYFVLKDKHYIAFPGALGRGVQWVYTLPKANTVIVFKESGSGYDVYLKSRQDIPKNTPIKVYAGNSVLSRYVNGKWINFEKELKLNHYQDGEYVVDREKLFCKSHEDSCLMEGTTNSCCPCSENSLFCVPKKCGCDVKTCNNIPPTLITNKTYTSTDNAIEGKGLFAKSSLLEEEWVIEFVGEVITSDELNYRSQYYDKFNYCFISELFGFVIDPTRAGSDAKYANHSCNPNCEAIEGYDQNGVYHLYLKVKKGKSLVPHEEITWDYNEVVDTEEELVQCRCQAPMCKGNMNSLRSSDPERVKAYKKREKEVIKVIEDKKTEELYKEYEKVRKDPNFQITAEGRDEFEDYMLAMFHVGSSEVEADKWRSRYYKGTLDAKEDNTQKVGLNKGTSKAKTERPKEKKKTSKKTKSVVSVGSSKIKTVTLRPETKHRPVKDQKYSSTKTKKSLLDENLDGGQSNKIELKDGIVETPKRSVDKNKTQRTLLKEQTKEAGAASLLSQASKKEGINERKKEEEREDSNFLPDLEETPSSALPKTTTPSTKDKPIKRRITLTTLEQGKPKVTNGTPKTKPVLDKPILDKQKTIEEQNNIRKTKDKEGETTIVKGVGSTTPEKNSTLKNTKSPTKKGLKENIENQLNPLRSLNETPINISRTSSPNNLPDLSLSSWNGGVSSNFSFGLLENSGSLRSLPVSDRSLSTYSVSPLKAFYSVDSNVSLPSSLGEKDNISFTDMNTPLSWKNPSDTSINSSRSSTLNVPSSTVIIQETPVVAPSSPTVISTLSKKKEGDGEKSLEESLKERKSQTSTPEGKKRGDLTTSVDQLPVGKSPEFLDASLVETGDRRPTTSTPYNSPADDQYYPSLGVPETSLLSEIKSAPAFSQQNLEDEAKWVERHQKKISEMDEREIQNLLQTLISSNDGLPAFAIPLPSFTPMQSPQIISSDSDNEKVPSSLHSKHSVEQNKSNPDKQTEDVLSSTFNADDIEQISISSSKNSHYGLKEEDMFDYTMQNKSPDRVGSDLEGRMDLNLSSTEEKTLHSSLPLTKSHIKNSAESPVFEVLQKKEEGQPEYGKGTRTPKDILSQNRSDPVFPLLSESTVPNKKINSGYTSQPESYKPLVLGPTKRSLDDTSLSVNTAQPRQRFRSSSPKTVLGRFNINSTEKPRVDGDVKGVTGFDRESDPGVLWQSGYAEQENDGIPPEMSMRDDRENEAKESGQNGFKTGVGDGYFPSSSSDDSSDESNTSNQKRFPREQKNKTKYSGDKEGGKKNAGRREGGDNDQEGSKKENRIYENSDNQRRRREKREDRGGVHTKEDPENSSGSNGGSSDDENEDDPDQEGDGSDTNHPTIHPLNSFRYKLLPSHPNKNIGEVALESILMLPSKPPNIVTESLLKTLLTNIMFSSRSPEQSQQEHIKSTIEAIQKVVDVLHAQNQSTKACLENDNQLIKTHTDSMHKTEELKLQKQKLELDYAVKQGELTHKQQLSEIEHMNLVHKMEMFNKDMQKLTLENAQKAVDIESTKLRMEHGRKYFFSFTREQGVQLDISNEPCDVYARQEFDKLWHTTLDHSYAELKNIISKMIQTNVIKNIEMFKTYMQMLQETGARRELRDRSDTQNVLQKRIELTTIMGNRNIIPAFQTGPVYTYDFYRIKTAQSSTLNHSIRLLYGNPRYAIILTPSGDFCGTDLWDPLLLRHAFPVEFPYYTKGLFEETQGIDEFGTVYNEVYILKSYEMGAVFQAAVNLGNVNLLMTPDLRNIWFDLTNVQTSLKDYTYLYDIRGRVGQAARSGNDDMCLRLINNTSTDLELYTAVVECLKHLRSSRDLDPFAHRLSTIDKNLLDHEDLTNRFDITSALYNLIFNDTSTVNLQSIRFVLVDYPSAHKEVEMREDLRELIDIQGELVNNERINESKLQLLLDLYEESSRPWKTVNFDNIIECLDYVTEISNQIDMTQYPRLLKKIGRVIIQTFNFIGLYVTKNEHSLFTENEEMEDSLTDQVLVRKAHNFKQRFSARLPPICNSVYKLLYAFNLHSYWIYIQNFAREENILQESSNSQFSHPYSSRPLTTPLTKTMDAFYANAMFQKVMNDINSLNELVETYLVYIQEKLQKMMYLIQEQQVPSLVMRTEIEGSLRELERLEVRRREPYITTLRSLYAKSKIPAGKEKIDRMEETRQYYKNTIKELRRQLDEIMQQRSMLITKQREAEMLQQEELSRNFQNIMQDRSSTIPEFNYEKQKKRVPPSQPPEWYSSDQFERIAQRLDPVSLSGPEVQSVDNLWGDESHRRNRPVRSKSPQSMTDSNRTTDSEEEVEKIRPRIRRKCMNKSKGTAVTTQRVMSPTKPNQIGRPNNPQSPSFPENTVAKSTPKTEVSGTSHLGGPRPMDYNKTSGEGFLKQNPPEVVGGSKQESIFNPPKQNWEPHSGLFPAELGFSAEILEYKAPAVAIDYFPVSEQWRTNKLSWFGATAKNYPRKTFGIQYTPLPTQNPHAFCLRENIKGDGNCFFRTIAHIIFGNSDAYNEIKTMVYSYVVTHKTELRHLVTELHLHEILTEGAFSSSEIIIATSLYLNTKIYLHVNLSPVGLWCTPGAVLNYETGRNPLTNEPWNDGAIYIYHVSWSHYEPVHYGIGNISKKDLIFQWNEPNITNNFVVPALESERTLFIDVEFMLRVLYNIVCLKKGYKLWTYHAIKYQEDSTEYRNIHSLNKHNIDGEVLTSYFGLILDFHLQRRNLWNVVSFSMLKKTINIDWAKQPKRMKKGHIQVISEDVEAARCVGNIFSTDLFVHHCTTDVGSDFLNQDRQNKKGHLFWDCPEALMLNLLVSKPLGIDEAILLRGLGVYSYEDHSTKTIPVINVVCVDFLTYDDNTVQNQYIKSHIDRELYKLSVAFCSEEYNMIRTGHGTRENKKIDVYLRFILQWMVCSMFDKDMLYYIADATEEKVCRQIISQCEEKTITDLYSYITNRSYLNWINRLKESI